MILPNQLTVLRIILTPIFLIFFLIGEPWAVQLSLLIFLLAAITDWYDGWLARKFNYITEWGKFMDPLADKILTSTAFIGFVIIGILPLWMVILVTVRDLIVTLLRAYADYKKVSFITSYSAKVKTFMQMIFLYYLLLVYTLSTFGEVYQSYKPIFEILMNTNAIYFIMLVLTLFTLVTGVTYIISNKVLVKKIFTHEN